MNTVAETTTLEIKYAGFWRRIGSQIVDIVIFSPFILLAYLCFNSKL